MNIPELDARELKVETFRKPGQGGWSQQPETHVRITHMPTGISVDRHDDRSVHMNRANAMVDLTAAVAKYHLNVAKSTIAPSQVKMYGCHDQPRPVAGQVTHYAQDGYHYTDLTESGRTERHAVVVPIRHVFTTDCQYDLQRSDKRCSNCIHIRK